MTLWREQGKVRALVGRGGPGTAGWVAEGPSLISHCTPEANLFRCLLEILQMGRRLTCDTWLSGFDLFCPVRWKPHGCMRYRCLDSQEP